VDLREAERDGRKHQENDRPVKMDIQLMHEIHLIMHEIHLIMHEIHLIMHEIHLIRT
jgi:hypothetical protein